MHYNKINGVEINPERTFTNFGRIYINEGTFESPNSIIKFEETAISFKCSEWVGNGYARINVYYNPDINKIQLLPENVQAPNETYGYHLGGITLKEVDDHHNCLDKILLPDNGLVEHNKFFNYEYDEAYYHLYHAERPENIFDDGFDGGYQDENTLDQEVQNLFG